MSWSDLEIILCAGSISKYVVLLVIYDCVLFTGWLAYFSEAFRDELGLLQKIRHPNVVQFLGAVTQSTPMMIVTEYLPKVSLESIFYLNALTSHIT